MAENVSISLNKHFEEFILDQVRSGKFSSATEVVKAALRLFELEEKKKERLLKELQVGEDSGFNTEFDPEVFLLQMHTKFAQDK